MAGPHEQPGYLGSFVAAQRLRLPPVLCNQRNWSGLGGCKCCDVIFKLLQKSLNLNINKTKAQRHEMTCCKVSCCHISNKNPGKKPSSVLATSDLKETERATSYQFSLFLSCQFSLSPSHPLSFPFSLPPSQVSFRKMVEGWYNEQRKVCQLKFKVA